MSKKEEILKYLESMIGDLSSKTVQIYRDKFEGMSDAQITKFFKDGNEIKLFVKDDEVTQKKVDDLIKRTGYVTEERIVYPEKKNATSIHKMMVLPVQIRRLQQVSTTESNSNVDAEVRNKVNQAVRESRTAQLTDTEVAMMAGVGLDKTLSELLSARSDNQMMKNTMNRLIREKGSFSLNELPKTPNSRNSLLYIDALYKGMNLATDLVDDISDIS